MITITIVISNSKNSNNDAIGNDYVIRKLTTIMLITAPFTITTGNINNQTISLQITLIDLMIPLIGWGCGGGLEGGEGGL